MFKITTEIEVKFRLPDMPADELEVAYPKIEITYGYSPGRPAYTPRGEYAPIDPPDPPEIDFVSARLIDGDGLAPTGGQVDEWASNWLGEEGFDEACENAEMVMRPDPDEAYERMRDDG